MNYDRLDVPLIDWSQTPEDARKNFKGPQNPKQCKPKTPDFVEGVPAVKETKKREGKDAVPQIGFRAKDKVFVLPTLVMHQTGTAAFKIPTKSLFNVVIPMGDYIFDSYDSYDNTCFILNEKSGMTYNVLLTDIILKENYE